MNLFFKKPVKRGKQAGNSLTFLLTSAVVLSLSLATTTVALGPMIPKEQQNASTSRAYQDVAEQHLDAIQSYIQANPSLFIQSTSFVTDTHNARTLNDGLPDYQHFMNDQAGFDTFFSGHLYNGQDLRTFTRNGSDILVLSDQNTGVPITSKMQFFANNTYGLVRFFGNGSQGLYRNVLRATVSVTDNSTGRTLSRSRTIPLAADKCVELSAPQDSYPLNRNATYGAQLSGSYRVTQVSGSAIVLGDMNPNPTVNGSPASANSGRRSQYFCWLPTESNGSLSCETGLQFPTGLEILNAQQDLVYSPTGNKYYQRRMVAILFHNRYPGASFDGDDLAFYYWDGRTPPGDAASSYDSSGQDSSRGYVHDTDIDDIDVSDIHTPAFAANSRPEDYSFTVFRPQVVTTGSGWGTDQYKGLLINKYYNGSNWVLRYAVGYWGDRDIDHSKGLFKRGSNARLDHDAQTEWNTLYVWPDGAGQFDYFRYFPQQRTIVATQSSNQASSAGGVARRIRVWRMNPNISGTASTWFPAGAAYNVTSDMIPQIETGGTGFSDKLRFGRPEISADGDYVVVPVATNTKLNVSGNANIAQVRLVAFNTRGVGIVQNTNARDLAAVGTGNSTLKNATVIMSFTNGDGGTEATGASGTYGTSSKGWHVNTLQDINTWYSPKTKKFYWMVRNAHGSGGTDANTKVFEWDPKTWGAGNGASNGGWLTNNNAPDRQKTGLAFAGTSPNQASSIYTGEFNSVRMIGNASDSSSVTLWNSDQPPKVIENPKGYLNEAYIRDSQGVVVLNYDTGYSRLASTAYDSTRLGNGYTLAVDSDTGLVYFAVQANPGLRAYNPATRQVWTPSTAANTNFNDGIAGDGNLFYVNATHNLYFLDTLNSALSGTQVPQFHNFHLTCSALPTQAVSAGSVFNTDADTGLTYKPSFNSLGGGSQIGAQSALGQYATPYAAENFGGGN